MGYEKGICLFYYIKIHFSGFKKFRHQIQIFQNNYYAIFFKGSYGEYPKNTIVNSVVQPEDWTQELHAQTIMSIDWQERLKSILISAIKGGFILSPSGCNLPLHKFSMYWTRSGIVHKKEKQKVKANRKMKQLVNRWTIFVMLTLTMKLTWMPKHLRSKLSN